MHGRFRAWGRRGPCEKPRLFRPPGTQKKPHEAHPEGSALSAKALCILRGLENARSLRVQGAGFRVCVLNYRA